MRIPISIRTSILLLLITSTAVASNLENVIKIDAGLVAGMGTSVRVYKGIPYAAPPVGELRWRAPQPVKPWTSIRAANSYSPICIQSGMGPGAPANSTSEDCLTINVWTPAKRAGMGSSDKLPVVFSIHGGGFEIGGSSPSVYDGERLASQGVVVVTFNYRVGVMGFLAHPELGRESEGRSGNYGLLDIIAALNWIQRNIGAFGGDPSNVTIWGESAGATAVSLLLVSPPAAGLFHKAIANSAWCMYYPMRHLHQTWGKYEAFETTGARMGDLATLRGKAAADIVKLDSEIVGSGILGADSIERGGICRPVVDGDVIPDDPATLFSAGKFHRVPVMMGTNADEGSVILFAPRVSNLEQATTWLNSTFGSQAAPKLAELYAITSDSNARTGAVKLAGDALFAMGTRAMLRAASKYQANVYQYEFTRVSGLGLRTKWGAMHGSDLGYTFGTLPESLFAILGLPTLANDYNDVDEQLSRAMQGAIAQFAKTGDPNGPALPKWPSFRDGEKYLEYGDTIAVKQSLYAKKLDILDDAFERRRSGAR